MFQIIKEPLSLTDQDPFTEGKELFQTYITLEKSNCPQNLITARVTLGSNSCNQAFVIAGSGSFTSLWRNFDPVLFAEVF